MTAGIDFPICRCYNFGKYTKMCNFFRRELADAYFEKEDTMKFYSFGQETAPVIFLLPGTCCHWQANFGGVIPLLERTFHVVCVSYDGFDEGEQTVFPDMLTQTEKIEDYIQARFQGRICAAYGCSLGGSFVGLLVQRKRVHISHGILGSSDLDQSSGAAAWLQAWLVSQVLYGMFQKGKLPGFMEKRLEKKPAEERGYYEKMLTMFGMGNTRMAFVSKQSIRNQFYSDLVTALEDGISVPGTVVHCFYAEKMGEQYLQRYCKHFKDPVIHRHPMNHEELLICHPEAWAGEVCRCCGLQAE